MERQCDIVVDRSTMMVTAWKWLLFQPCFHTVFTVEIYNKLYNSYYVFSIYPEVVLGAPAQTGKLIDFTDCT